MADFEKQHTKPIEIKTGGGSKLQLGIRREAEDESGNKYVACHLRLQDGSSFNAAAGEEH